MSCLHPILVKRSKRIPYQKDVYIQVPCGHCVKCLARLQSQWSLRMEFESFDPQNKFQCFITLTYADKFLPPGLDKTHFQSFIDRLRTNLKRKYDHFVRVRYFCCGEYGDKFGRPHMHAILYCSDKISYSDIKNAWHYGIVDIRDFSLARCGYVAKYSVKQLKNSYVDLPAPFHLCSSGLGSYFLKRYGSYVYRKRLHSWINLSGYEVPLPRYYIDKIYPKGSIGRSSYKVDARLYFRRKEALNQSRFVGVSFYRDNYIRNDKYENVIYKYNFERFVSRNYG